MKTVLVTGANGFIGRHVLPLLVNSFDRVHAITSQATPSGVHANIQWYTCNLLDTDQIRALIPQVRPDALLHLAWNTTPGSYWTTDENYAWTTASMELLRAFRAEGGQRVVTAGTMAEYDWNYGHLVAGVTPYRPATPYGASKHALQLMQAQFAAQSDMSSAWGHIFFGYGPHERPQRVIPHVVTQLLRGEPAQTSHGRQIRDFMYVADVAAALVALLQSSVGGPVNIASGRPHRLRDVLTQAELLLNATGHIQFGARPAAANDPIVLTADVSRLRDEVKWQPHYTLADGLSETIQWWRNHLSIEKDKA